MAIETATDIYADVLALLAKCEEDPRPGAHGASFDNGYKQALTTVLRQLEDDYGVMSLLPKRAAS